jgi:AraC-like DNA-binding protein
VVFSDYREFPVPERLADYFMCFWTQAIGGLQKEYAHRVFPDGCVDIVFLNDEAPVVVGPWNEPFVARFVPGTKILGARLRPGYASSVLGVPCVELLNRSVPLSAVWGGPKSSEFACVGDRSGPQERRSILVETLVRRLASTLQFDQAVAASVQWLARYPHGRVHQLSDWLGISDRQLQRRFSSSVGYGPKMFQSVLRFQRLLYLGDRKGGPRGLADLATDVGYSDQAHLTREVRRFADCPPTALLASAECTLRMSDLFKTGDNSPRYRREP